MPRSSRPPSRRVIRYAELVILHGVCKRKETGVLHYGTGRAMELGNRIRRIHHLSRVVAWGAKVCVCVCGGLRRRPGWSRARFHGVRIFRGRGKEAMRSLHVASFYFLFRSSVRLVWSTTPLCSSSSGSWSNFMQVLCRRDALLYCSIQ